MKILITEGAYKHTLAIARELGIAGNTVHVIDIKGSLSSVKYSKYCKKQHLFNPFSSESEFIDQLLPLLKQEQFDLLLAVGFPIVNWVSKNNEEILKYTKTFLPTYDVLSILEDKEKSAVLAERVGVPTPQTFYPTSLNDVEMISTKISYPVVIKGVMEIGGNLVDYASDAEELLTKYRKISLDKNTMGKLPMIQQYLTGIGKGFFALYNKGECVQYFMHERIREYPVSGGSSTCAKSIFDDQILSYGKRILDEARYHGIAMVEFKCDSEGNPFLLEVNPKFWGSYDLSVACNINFSNKIINLIKGEKVDHTSYKNGIEFSWMFNGDLVQGLETGKFWSILRNSLKRNVKTNFWIRDFRQSVVLMYRALSVVLPLMVLKLVRR
jgi:predicted ATP-grasp superfamily ATP-dependent carboligase